jgi:CDP-paratose 2-epimerase
VRDLFDDLSLQLETPSCWDGRVYKLGGANDVSVSLKELTELCIQETGKTVPIARVTQTAGVDLRIFVTDARKAATDFGWRPTRGPARIVRDIRGWIEEHQGSLESLLT